MPVDRIRPRLSILLTSLAFVSFTPQLALAGDFSVQLPAAGDNTLYETAGGTLSNGAGERLFAGVVDSGGGETIRRAVLAFDVNRTLPPDAVITSVQLTLEMSMSIVGETNVDVHRLLADWGEGTSNAPGQEGAGTNSTTGDATWEHTFFDTASWTTFGGDFAAPISASAAVAGDGPYTWGSTSTLVSDVQGWVDTPSADFGWIVIGDEVSTPPTAKRFDSRENPTIAKRPRLVVGFASSSLVFLDNFESGDVTGWSSSFP